MIGVLIVDDEYLVRERLKISVNWSELGFHVVGEAADGEEALLMLEHADVQLAIVDINMPHVDGLEFARRARESKPHLKIVILTGYSSFEYAKTAMQTGVSDYLLKPINMDELNEVLIGLKSRIEEEAERNELHEHAMRNRLEIDHILRREFLQTLLDGTAGASFQEKLNQYAPRLQAGALVVIAIGIDRVGGTAGKTPDWQRFAVGNIAQEILLSGGVKHAETTNDNEDRTIVIVSIPSSEWARTELGFLHKTCGDAVRAVREHLKFTITAGIGSVRSAVDEVSASYRDAVTALNHSKFLGGDRVIRYDSLPSDAVLHDLSDIRDELLIQLRLGNARSIEQELQGRFAALKEQQSLGKLYLTLYELVATLNIYRAEAHIEPHEATGQPFDPVKLSDELGSLAAIEEWVLKLYRDAVAQAGSMKQSTPARLVEKAKRYIDERYAERALDLNAIASSIFVNPSYLSRIFKNETGYSVVEYLTRRRMIKAKELIDAGARNINFIAESVGYTDTNYFSKCFKRHYSVSPSKFMSGE